MNNENLENIVIRKYLNNKNYVVRIEKEKFKEKEKIKYRKNFVVKVYYQGIQSFIVKKNTLILNVAMFTIKGNKDFPNITDEKYKNDIEFLEKKGFEFEFGSVVSRSRNEELKALAKKDFYVKVEPGKKYNKEKAEITMNDIKNKLERCLNLEIDHKEIDNTNYFLFNNNKLDYSNCVQQIKKIVTCTTDLDGVRKIELNEKIISPKNITEKDLNEIDKIMERRIKDYIKEENEQVEKQFQQNLMVKMNETRNGINNDILKKEPFNKNTYPFLMEYNFYEDDILKKHNKSKDQEATKKGRVDNVFIKDNKILFVELKYDEEVIGGSHGIHRHLIDIYNSSKKNKRFREEIYDDIKIYNDGLEKYDKDYKKHQIKLNKDEFDKDIEFAIICGYSSDDKKETIKHEINNIKEKTYKDLVKPDEYKKEKKALGKADEELLTMTVDELIEKMKNINGFKCDVNIYLSDKEYKNITSIEKEKVSS